MRRPKQVIFARRAVGMIIVAATVSVAAACAPGNTEQPTDALDTQGKDIARWTLPLDPYLLSDVQLTKAAYAEAIAINECLADSGIDHPVPYVDIDAAYGSVVTVRKWFDLTIAQTYGYHDPSQQRPAGLKAWEDFQHQASTPSEDEAFLACRDDPAAQHLPERGDIRCVCRTRSGPPSDRVHCAVRKPCPVRGGRVWHHPRAVCSPGGPRKRIGAATRVSGKGVWRVATLDAAGGHHAAASPVRQNVGVL